MSITIDANKLFWIYWLAYTSLYCLLAGVMILLYPAAYSGTLIWPAAGVGVGALLRLDHRAWSVSFVGATCTSLLLQNMPVGYAVIEGVAASTEAVLCVWLLRRFDFCLSLSRVIDIWRLFAAAVLSAMLCSHISLLPYVFSDKLSWTLYIDALMRHNNNHALGIFIITPLFLTWINAKQPVETEDKMNSRILLYGLALVCGCGFYVVSTTFSGAFKQSAMLLTYPPLAWATLYLPLKDVVMSLFIESVILVSAPFMGISMTAGCSELFLWITALMMLSIYTLLAFNRNLLADLNEKHFQVTTLLEALPDYIYLKDGSGRWMVANQPGLAFFQLKNNEAWRGKTDEELAKAISSRELRAIFKDCIANDEDVFCAGKSLLIERRIPGRDGKLKNIEIRKFPRFAEDGSRMGLGVIARDISQQKAVVEALKKSKIQYQKQVDLLQTVVDALPAQVGLLDNKGRILTVNRSWGQLCQEKCTFVPLKDFSCSEYFSHCPQIQINVSELSFLHSDIALQGIAQVLKGEIPQFIYEFESVAAKKSIKKQWSKMIVTPICSDSTPDGAVVMILDISQSKIAGDIIRQREQQYRTITEYSPDMIIRIGSAGQILFANKALVAYLQRSEFGLIGLKIATLWGGEYTAQQWSSALERVMVEQATQVELVFETDNTLHEKRVFQAYLVQENTGSIDYGVSILAVIRDVTLLKENESRLIASRNQLRLLAADAEMIREAEKKHIARELHDELGQLLSALRLDIGLFKMQYAQQLPELIPRAVKMMDILERAILCTHTVVDNIRPTVLDMGLEPALEWLRDDFFRMFGIRCIIQITGVIPVLSEAQVTSIFRIIQESLTNAAKHAKTKKVNIDITVYAGNLNLIVKDNGIGFSSQVDEKSPKGFGLMGMRERAIALGGKLELNTVLGEGGYVILNIPV